MLPIKYICSHSNLIKMKKNCAFKELQSQKLFSSVKHIITLMPDIEKDLDSGEMKHRKHPGIRKIAPIKLPTLVRDAIYRLISNQNEHLLLEGSHELCKGLYSRRLPLEMDEIENKIYTASSALNETGQDIPEVIKKERFLQLKKEIQTEEGRWKPLEYDPWECLLYLAGRAAPNYASTFRVFNEIKSRDPTFQPKTFFDFGSGIGSSVWAANSFWNDSIKEYFCVDSSSEMNELSQNILTVENTDEMCIKPVTYRQFLPASEKIKYDLVVSAFSLLDLSCAKERLRVIDTLWRKTNDMLVVIEQGNLAGFTTVLDARDYILHIENRPAEEVQNYSTGAHVICPCPHDDSCPIVKKYNDPCGVTVSYETIFPRHSFRLRKDWISYIVLRKGHRPQNDTTWPRVIKPVLKKSQHVHCRLCCKDGQIHEIIVTKSKHGRHEYRTARSSSIGDLLPVSVKKATSKIDVDFVDELCSQNSDTESDDEQNKR